MPAVARDPWWPSEDEWDELVRRANAALAEVGIDPVVSHLPSGFHWRSGLRAIEPQIERACELAWQSHLAEH